MDRGASRWRHMLYLAAYGVVGAFVLGFFAVVTIESSGPVEVDSGRVVERIEAEGEICFGVGRGRSCKPSPVYAIVGERADGSTWSVAGEDPYRLVRAGEPVEISTSTVTGRVVEIIAEEGTWAIRESGFRLLAYAWLILALIVGISLEYGRRKLGTVRLDGPFKLADFVVVPPAILLGLFGIRAGLFNTEDLSGWSAVDEYGVFIDDPLDFDLRADASPVLDDDGHVILGLYSGDPNLAVVVVPRGDLTEEVRQSIDSVPSDVLAVPIVGRSARGGPVELLLVDPADLEDTFPDQVKGDEPIDCPESVIAYPTVLGEDDDVRGGFVCFDSADVGAETVMRITTGSGLSIERRTYVLER